MGPHSSAGEVQPAARRNKALSRASNLVLPATPGGQNQDRKAPAFLAQPADQLNAGQPGQAQVDNAHINRVFQSEIQPFVTIRRLVHSIAELTQTLGQLFAQRGFVFNNQYTHGKSPPAT